MFIDDAIRNFPQFERMSLEQARNAYCEWVDQYWDFDKKAEEYKANICNNITSVQQIALMAWGAADKGNRIKNKAKNGK